MAEHKSSKIHANNWVTDKAHPRQEVPEKELAEAHSSRFREKNDEQKPAQGLMQASTMPKNIRGPPKDMNSNKVISASPASSLLQSSDKLVTHFKYPDSKPGADNSNEFLKMNSTQPRAFVENIISERDEDKLVIQMLNARKRELYNLPEQAFTSPAGFAQPNFGPRLVTADKPDVGVIANKQMQVPSSERHVRSREERPAYHSNHAFASSKCRFHLH